MKSGATIASIIFGLALFGWVVDGAASSSGEAKPEPKPGGGGGGGGGATAPTAQKPTVPAPEKDPPVPAQPLDGKGVPDGLTWLEAAPKDAGPLREAYFWRAIIEGGARVDWTRIQIGDAVIPVFARTMRVGLRRPVRITLNYETQQAVADLLGCAMMTPAIAIAVYKQAQVRLAPQTRNWFADGTMSKTSRLIEYTLDLDKLVSPDDTRLVVNEGKDWVLSIRFWRDPSALNHYPPAKKAANFGWITHVDPLALNQPVGLVHTFPHTDYSQQVRLVSQWWLVRGAPMHYKQALADPTLGPLLASGEACGTLVHCPNGPKDLLLPATMHPYFLEHSPTLGGKPFPGLNVPGGIYA